LRGFGFTQPIPKLIYTHVILYYPCAIKNEQCPRDTDNPVDKEMKEVLRKQQELA
jgi:hypothetical protein